MEETIGPDTVVKMDNGEEVSMSEFFARQMEAYMDARMNDEFVQTVRQCIRSGATYEKMRSLYEQALDANTKQQFQKWGMDFDLIYRRLYEKSIVRATD